MDNLRECKGCSRSVDVNIEDIQRMIDEIISCDSFRLVSREQYDKRLYECQKCKYMQFDTTCSQCGCIVQVRALLKDKDCPDPLKSRWQ